MTHTYSITGMTCAGCKAKVQSLLSGIKGVNSVEIDLHQGKANITMNSHIPTVELQKALEDYPKYQLSETDLVKVELPESEKSSGWTTYKPIFLVFAYIIGITVAIELLADRFVWERWLNYFMAGFFLVFSFFKLINLKGFAESYATYDIVAKKWPAWGYIYAFIELGLGVSFLLGLMPVITNGITLVIMTISIIGVLQTVLHKRKIRCACLGAVFNLPMSTITVIEDGLMIAMSAIMIVHLN